MAANSISLSPEARSILDDLGGQVAASGKVPRLAKLEVVALNLEEPQEDDLVVEDNGVTVLAVSHQLLEQFAGDGVLVVVGFESGEPQFRIVRKIGPDRDLGGAGWNGEAVSN